MSDRFDIKESEAGVVRVFHIDLPPEAIERYTVQAGTGEWPLKYGLGAKQLSGAFVEVVDLDDLGAMPLSTYLTEAYGVSRGSLADTKARLDGLRGHVLILPSQAFGRVAQTLTVRTPLRWVGSYEENKASPKGAALRSASAIGSMAGGGGRGGPNLQVLRTVLMALAAVVALVVLMFLFLG